MKTTISTHAPLARCDMEIIARRRDKAYFNSRTSCEVRPYQAPKFGAMILISTHAPLARCDRNIL